MLQPFPSFCDNPAHEVFGLDRPRQPHSPPRRAIALVPRLLTEMLNRQTKVWGDQL